MQLRTLVRLTLSLFTCLMLLTPAARAAEGEWLELQRGDRTLRVWLARPAGGGPAPTIIVIHANRGLNDWTRSVADRLAQHGYIAAAPDLLSGTGPGGGGTAAFADSNAARDGIYALDQGQVLGDLNALTDHLGAMQGSNGEVSVSGFCWGGSRTFWFATERPDLKAAYVFYGTAPDDAEALGRIGARVYGFYGGDDERVNATIDRTRAQMEAAGKTYEPVVYPGAGHGFLSRGEGDEASEANREAAELAWQRWLELLG